MLAATALTTGVFVWWALHPIALKAAAVDVNIPAGSSLRVALRQLDSAGAPVAHWLFVALARLARAENSIKAGSYELHAPISPWQLLEKLARGDVSEGELVLPEGWTFKQLRERVDANADLRHDSQGLSDGELLSRIGAQEPSPEGLFFPDTYLFDKQSSDLALYARAYRAMRRKLHTVWVTRQESLPLTDPYQALVLASIIEKETGHVGDRSLVAAVFVNRLRRGMPLQTDPTVIYGLGSRYDGSLHKRDLQDDTPYNTYTRPGLPPTPIAMPGEASLKAAVNPAPSLALYFVARGDGSSEFSETLDAHNRAVSKFLRNGR